MDAVSANSGSAPSPDRDALWERHGEPLVTLCTRATGSAAAGRRAAAGTFAAVVGADPGPVGPRLALAKAALRCCERELAAEPVAESVDGATPAGNGPLAALVARTAAANAELPAADRALLALRLVSNLTHEQIATLIGDEEERVAGRLAAARRALRARLHGAPAPEPASGDCERGLALIARRQDGERLSPEDSTWLATHEAACAGCAAARQAMQEADVAYRAWPVGRRGRCPRTSLTPRPTRSRRCPPSPSPS